MVFDDGMSNRRTKALMRVDLPNMLNEKKRSAICGAFFIEKWRTGDSNP